MNGTNSWNVGRRAAMLISNFAKIFVVATICIISTPALSATSIVVSACEYPAYVREKGSAVPGKGIFYTEVAYSGSGSYDTGYYYCFEAFADTAQGACDALMAQLNSQPSSAVLHYIVNSASAVSSINDWQWGTCKMSGTFYINFAGSTTSIPQSWNPALYKMSEPISHSFIITLSGGSEVEPSNGSTLNTLPFIATVKDQSTGQPPTAAVTVHVSLKVDPKSGGHDHGDSDRPRGGIAGVQTCASDAECWSGKTDGNGQVVFNFNPTEASGTHTITATCQNDGCTNTATKSVDVKLDGLEIVMDSSFYTFIGGEVGKPHHDNHYLMPDAATVLRNMAISYRIEDKFWQLKNARRGKPGQYTYTPPSVLYVNDASLIWGGKFDIHGKWKGDHKGHRRGIVADIRANQININNGAIPLQSFTNFQKMAKAYNANAQVHCSDDGQDRQPPACIGTDGSQDEGRHFHVILIGGVDK